MAKRRGPPDLKEAFESLVRSTLQQVGVVREVVGRGAEAQRSWFDAAVLQRKRREALAELGAAVYELAADGRLGDLTDFPELEPLLGDIEDIDERLADAERRADRSVRAATGTARGRRRSGSGRRGFGDRRVSERPEPRVWRPTMPDDDPEPEPPPRAPRHPVRATEDSGGISFEDPDDLDDDLEEYMHDDDVPPAPTRGASRSQRERDPK